MDRDSFDLTWSTLGNVTFNEKSNNGKEIGIDIDFIYSSNNLLDSEYFVINMFGSKYELGYSETINKGEYHQWCTKDGINITCHELNEMVKNFIQLNREYKIGNLLGKK